MNELHAIRDKINDIIDEHGEAFFDKGIKSRASKIRKGLQEIKGMAHEARKTVQHHKEVLSGTAQTQNGL